MFCLAVFLLTVALMLVSANPIPQYLSSDDVDDQPPDTLSNKLIIPGCNPETSEQFLNNEDIDSVQVLSLLPRQSPELACPAKGHQLLGKNRNFGSPGLQQQPGPNSPNEASQDGLPLPCDKHGLLNIPLTCAGPEVLYNGLITVANCVAGIHHTSVPTRGRLPGSNQVAKYCCAVFWADHSPWIGDRCVKIASKVKIDRLNQVEFQAFLNDFWNNR